MTLLEVKALKKTYTTRLGGHLVPALTNVSFSVEEGEYLAIMGESGSGKTTLLNIVASLDQPTGGQVLLEGKDLGSIPERNLADFRRKNLGFVFQDFNLLDTFSIRDNIYLPLVLSGVNHGEMARRLAPWPKSWPSRTCWTSTPMRSPAGRSSGPPWPGPVSPSPGSSWPTSPQGLWTPARPTSCWTSLPSSTGRGRPSSW